MSNFPKRSELVEGMVVEIIMEYGKKKSFGIIKDILTKAETHPHGIMVEINTGEKGRVERLLGEEEYKKLFKKTIKKEFDHIKLGLKNLGKTIQESNNELKNNQEENLMTEFKSTFKFDTKLEIFKKQGKNEEVQGRKKDEGKIQHALKKEIAIAVAAFANSDGGQLIIGKNDEGEISEYFENDKKMYKNWDVYTLAIINSIEEFTKNRPFVSQIRLVPDNDKKFLTLEIPKSTSEPIIIFDKEQEEFYIRAVVGKSQKMQPSEMINYAKIRFPQWIGKRI